MPGLISRGGIKLGTAIRYRKKKGILKLDAQSKGGQEIKKCTIIVFVQFAVVVNRIFRRLVDSVVNLHNSRLVAASVTVVGS